MKSVWRVLGQGEPSEPALARLQASILDELAQPLLLNGMKGERAMVDELIRRLENGTVSISVLTRGSEAPSSGLSVGDRLLAVLARGVPGGQRGRALEWMNDAVAISRQPTFEQPALWAAWDRKIVAVKESRLGKLTAMIPLMLLPATKAASMSFAKSRAELGATAILIAAERQRRRTGKWPASIEAIDPGILAKPPVDPFSGQPFQIEHRHGELVIYSIGPNARDQHGEFDAKRWIRGGPDDIGARAWDVILRARRAGATVK